MILEAGESIIGYDEYGAGNTTVVLLHAFPLSRGQWRAQGEALARQGYHVLAPDLRGFGESSVQVGPITVDEMAADVRALLDALHIDHAIFGGLSLGGYVALSALRHYPERIQGLILADTRATPDSPQQRSAREETSRLASAQGPVAVLDRDLPKLLTERTRSQHQDVVTRVRNLARASSDIGISAAALGMGLRPDSTPQLRQTTLPALVLVGDDDVMTPSGDAVAMYDELRNAHLAVIPHAGHLSNLEQPDHFTSHLTHFLERVQHKPHEHKHEHSPNSAHPQPQQANA